MKKNILSKILALGIVITPVLVVSTLNTSSNYNLNDNTLPISNKNAVDKPMVGADGIINIEFVKELTAYKKATITNWDGSLLESDFEGATSVADNAFLGFKQFTSITLPNTVLKIGTDAFKFQDQLKTISALGATSIGANAFAGANAIIPQGIKLTYNSESVRLGENNYWGCDREKLDLLPPPMSENDIITSAFVTELIYYKEDQKLININWNGHLLESDFEGATSVASGAFRYIRNTFSILLPNTVTSIGTNAFDSNSNLTTISALGATSIGDNAFVGTEKMSSGGIKLTYSANNIYFGAAEKWGTTIDKLDIIGAPSKPLAPNGIITSNFVIELIAYKKTLLPSGVIWDGILDTNDFIGANNVDDGAFQNNIEVTSITLPNTVQTIGTNAFNASSNLKTIYALGATNISVNAFAGIDTINDAGITLSLSNNVGYAKAEFWGTTTNKLSILSEPPKVPQNGDVTIEFVNDLIRYKKAIEPSGIWNGVLIATDFIDATSIGEKAFFENTELKAIELPLTLKFIGPNAFDGATNLTTISAPGVEVIHENGLLRTTSLLKIELSYRKDLRDDWLNWGLGTTQSDFNRIEWINPPAQKPILPSDKIVGVQYIQEIILYEQFKLIEGFNGTIDEKYLNGAKITDNAFEINDILFPVNTIKILELNDSIQSISENSLRNSDIETINISINHYPSIGTFGLEQTKFNGLSWIDTDTLLNGGEGVFDTLTNKKLFIAKSLEEGLAKMGIIDAKNLNGYTSIAPNAFGENVDEIHLPDNFDSINTDPEAFASAINLKEIFIPASSKITPTEFFEKYNIKPDVNVKSGSIEQALSDELQNSFIILATSFVGILILFISIVSFIFYSNKRKITKFEEMNLQLKKENEENEIESISDEISK